MTISKTTTPSTDTEPGPQPCGAETMTKQPFTFHEDPGHGWLEVPAVDIAANGLTETAFSRYSYVDRGKVSGPVYYLEEDCDLTLFAQAYENKHGQHIPMETVYHAGDCFVRGLERIGEVAS